MAVQEQQDGATRVAAALSEFVARTAWRLANEPLSDVSREEVSALDRFTTELRTLLTRPEVDRGA